MRYIFVNPYEQCVRGIPLMHLIVMSRDRVFIKAPPNVANMFVKTNPQCPFGPPDVLQSAGTLDEVDHPLS